MIINSSIIKEKKNLQSQRTFGKLIILRLRVIKVTIKNLIYKESYLNFQLSSSRMKTELSVCKSHIHI